MNVPISCALSSPAYSSKVSMIQPGREHTPTKRPKQSDFRAQAMARSTESPKGGFCPLPLGARIRISSQPASRECSLKGTRCHSDHGKSREIRATASKRHGRVKLKMLVSTAPFDGVLAPSVHFKLLQEKIIFKSLRRFATCLLTSHASIAVGCIHCC